MELCAKKKQKRVALFKLVLAYPHANQFITQGERNDNLRVFMS